MLKIIAAAAALALFAAPSFAKAPQCRDAKGHFLLLAARIAELQDPQGRV
ncbi:MAG: hypothetical protein JWO81_1571 [Alphaproteobacteria bacterium]|nr:hypothetical protein [Alphaproteobacteria bacterium]